MKRSVFSNRVVAFVLAVSVLMSFVGVLPASAASKTFDGYLYNGDFEAGVAGEWSFPSTASVVSGGYDGSGYCARLEGGQWTTISQRVTVEANTDYRLSGWVKRESGTGAHYLFAKRGDESCTPINNSQQWFNYQTPEWVQHVWEFNTGNTTTVTVYMCIDDKNSVFLYDDIILQKLSDVSEDASLVNGDFESGNTGGWLINTGTSINTEGRDGSTYALRFGGSAGSATRQFIRVKGMTDYRLTFYAKRVRGSGSNNILFKRGDVTLESINGTDGVVDDASKEWKEYTYEFNSGASTLVTLYIQMPSVSTTFLYDDFTLEEITGPDYSNILKGDANLDGVIDNSDLELINDSIANEALVEGAAYAADMNCDSVVDAEDAALLEEFLKTSAVPLYPINGETVANASWQVEELLNNYSRGVTDAYSDVAHRNDQYMRDPVVLRWLAPESDADSYYVLLADNSALTDAKRYLIENDNVTEKTLSIQNLMVNTDYYWAIEINGATSAVGTFHTADTVRTLWIDGVSNTRDIGGWLTEDGEYRVKYGVAYRGAKFDKITEAGKKAVADIGIKTDMDLRTATEGEKNALGDSVKLLLVGKMGAAMYYMYDNRTISDLEGDYVKGTANAVKAFANADNFPTYFHCSYGRDRTGTLAFLLLGLVGVSREDIRKDYEMTYLSTYGGGGLSAYEYVGYLDAMMDWVQETYGAEKSLKEAVEGYLLAIGVTGEEIEAIRANLLEPVAEAVVETGIEVSAVPTKSQYLEGKDELDLSGGKIKIIYSDGSYSDEIDMTEEMVSGFNNAVTGAQVLTVTYGDFTATFDVVVNEKSVTEIKVTTLPIKLQYLEGKDEFDPAGGVLTKYYDNDTTSEYDLTPDMVSGFDNTKVGPQSLTVSLSGYSTEIEVEIIAKSMTGIKITALPTKLEYIEGESLDLEGIEVTAYYNNGTEEVLDAEDYDVFGYESVVGENVVTVAVGEFIESFVVNVSASFKLGDPDDDGEITVADALFALRIAAKLSEEMPETIATCDVDGDGNITVADALAILRVAAKISDTL